MTRFDGLRPPAAGDPSAPAYKDWLHLNVFLPEAGVLALVNGSLHGPPGDGRSRAVGVALALGPDGDWRGGIEITGQDGPGVTPEGLLLETVALAASPDRGTLHASIRRPGDGLTGRMAATPLGGTLDIALETTFGSGWIGWSAVPLVALSGVLTLDGAEHPLDGTFGYHDHNWGRWFWGEDVAWEWGAFLFPERTVVVLARACDRAHVRFGPAHVILIRGGTRRAFDSRRTRLSREGRLGRVERRLPGALAAIHPDRRAPDLPARVVLTAEGPSAAFELAFEAASAAQLILAEPTRPGTAFINEIAGSCRLTAILDGRRLSAEGMGIFEHVE